MAKGKFLWFLHCDSIIDTLCLNELEKSINKIFPPEDEYIDASGCEVSMSVSTKPYVPDPAYVFDTPEYNDRRERIDREYEVLEEFAKSKGIELWEHFSDD